VETTGKHKNSVRPFMTEQQLKLMNLLVVEELTQEEAATQMCLSMGTIRFHVSNVLKLYEVPNLTIACVRYSKELAKEGKLIE